MRVGKVNQILRFERPPKGKRQLPHLNYIQISQVCIIQYIPNV